MSDASLGIGNRDLFNLVSNLTKKVDNISEQQAETKRGQSVIKHKLETGFIESRKQIEDLSRFVKAAIPEAASMNTIKGGVTQIMNDLIQELEKQHPENPFSPRLEDSYKNDVLPAMVDHLSRAIHSRLPSAVLEHVDFMMQDLYSFLKPGINELPYHIGKKVMNLYEETHKDFLNSKGLKMGS